MILHSLIRVSNHEKKITVSKVDTFSSFEQFTHRKWFEYLQHLCISQLSSDSRPYPAVISLDLLQGLIDVPDYPQCSTKIGTTLYRRFRRQMEMLTNRSERYFSIRYTASSKYMICNLFNISTTINTFLSLYVYIYI